MTMVSSAMVFSARVSGAMVFSARVSGSIVSGAVGDEDEFIMEPPEPDTSMDEGRREDFCLTWESEHSV